MVPVYLCSDNFTEIQQWHHRSSLIATLIAWKYQHSSKKSNL